MVPCRGNTGVYMCVYLCFVPRAVAPGDAK